MKVPTKNLWTLATLVSVLTDRKIVFLFFFFLVVLFYLFYF